MPTNLHIDDKLIAEACKVGKQPTKRAAVEEALKEYIQHRKQLGILNLRGKIDYYPDYDYKAQRRKCRS